MSNSKLCHIHYEFKKANQSIWNFITQNIQIKMPKLC